MRAVPPVLLLFALVLPASADVVELTNGVRLEGRATVDEAAGVVRVRIGRQEVEVPREAVVRILTGEGDGEGAALPDLAQGGGIDGSPLVAALHHPDKRIRYRAAITLARMKPETSFLAHDRVVEVLADAIGETTLRVVLIVAADRARGNRLVDLVREMNAIPVLAIGGVQGIERGQRFPSKDLILLDTALGGTGENGEPAFPIVRDYRQGYREIEDDPIGRRLMYSREVFLWLKRDHRTAGTPIVLLADEGYEETVGRIYDESEHDGILPVDVEGEALRLRVESVFQRYEEEERDNKAEALEIAREAARAVAIQDRERTSLVLDDALEALVETVDEPPGQLVRPDVLRIDALDALSTLARPAAYPALLRVFRNRANDNEVRMGAARAMGSTALVSGALPPEVEAVLTAGLGEPDPRIWKTCAEALGRVEVPAERVSGKLFEQRIPYDTVR